MALGKGLESLIPPKPSHLEEAKEKFLAGHRREHIFYIEVEKIKPNPFQPRRDFNAEELGGLAESMRQHGMLQPLLVSKIETTVPGGTKVEYQLIAGERRYKAALAAGLKQVPAIIKAPTDRTKLELSLIENVQRQDLNPIEEALAYQKLTNDFKLTQAQIASTIGKSREAVANKVRLLDLPYQAQVYLREGKIAEGHAKVLLMVKNPERQIFLAGEVFKKDISVRALEDLVRLEDSFRSKAARTIDPALEEYKKIAQEALGTPVAISGSKQKGRLAIHFYSEEDLERLIKKLTSPN